ncbi:MAG: glycosyltransferase family 2 protein [Candidatus Cryptobacteroides sp.]
MHYKVSVIIPVYNACRFIPRCVDSLMRQTLREVEYIFVEDCSTDGSYEVLLKALEAYPERKADVKILRHGKNMGVSVSRNDGNAAAAGDFLIHCDSDDWVDVTMYEKMYDKVIAEDADICICDYYNVSESDSVRMHPEIGCSQEHRKVVKDYLTWVWNPLWNLLVSRRTYEKSGVTIPEGINFTEDFYLSAHLFMAARRVTAVDEPLYYYNLVNPASIMHTYNQETMKQELRCYESLIGSMKEKGVYGYYCKIMQRRIVKAVASLVLANRFEEFRSLHPESHRYILSTPSTYLEPKVKIMLLLAALHLDFICRWDNRRHGRY